MGANDVVHVGYRLCDRYLYCAVCLTKWFTERDTRWLIPSYQSVTASHSAISLKSSLQIRHAMFNLQGCFNVNPLPKSQRTYQQARRCAFTAPQIKFEPCASIRLATFAQSKDPNRTEPSPSLRLDV